MESYFFNSDGFYIHIDDSVPLFLDINGPRPGSICFTAKVVSPYKKLKNFLNFRVCKFTNPRDAHENAIKDFLGMPSQIPDPFMVKNPIWSSWARYKVDVNSTIIYNFAQEIVKNGFPIGTLEIDDNWETCYGNSEFNASRFGDIKVVVSKLSKSMLIKIKTDVYIYVIYINDNVCIEKGNKRRSIINIGVDICLLSKKKKK